MLEQAMSEDLILKSSDFLPPTHQDIELYKFVSTLFDNGVNNFVLPYINQIRGIYDFSSEYFDPDYLIKITGSTELFNLLNNSLDKTAVVTLIPELLRIKGTQACIDVLFKLLKLGYKSIAVNDGLVGCKTITLILDDRANVDYQAIALLEQLINIYMSSCIRLGAVANCLPAGITDLTTTKLSNSSVLDTMVLSSSLGHKIDEISKNITFYLCNNTQAELEKLNYILIHYITKYRYSYFYYNLVKTSLLDMNITLDRTRLSPEDIFKHYRTLFQNHYTEMLNEFEVTTEFHKNRIIYLNYKSNLFDFKTLYRDAFLYHDIEVNVNSRVNTRLSCLDLNLIAAREYNNAYDNSYNINTDYVSGFETKSLALSCGDEYEISFNKDFLGENYLLHYGYGYTMHKQETA